MRARPESLARRLALIGLPTGTPRPQPRVCPACGLEIPHDEHIVRYRGDPYHGACALYRRGAG